LILNSLRQFFGLFPPRLPAEQHAQNFLRDSDTRNCGEIKAALDTVNPEEAMLF
jgi:hypothetical protein